MPYFKLDRKKCIAGCSRFIVVHFFNMAINSSSLANPFHSNLSLNVTQEVEICMFKEIFCIVLNTNGERATVRLCKRVQLGLWHAINKSFALRNICMLLFVLLHVTVYLFTLINIKK